VSEAEEKLAVAGLTAEALPDQRLENGLVINAEDFDRLRQGGASGEDAAGNWRNCAFR
jgi:hypothetical protein